MTILNEVWTLPLPEKYPPLEYYIERVKILEQQLAEARVALTEVDRGVPIRITLNQVEILDIDEWRERNAAALKAARSRP